MIRGAQAAIPALIGDRFSQLLDEFK